MIQQKPITATQAREQTKKSLYQTIESAILKAITENRFNCSIRAQYASTEFIREVIVHYQSRGFDCSFRHTDATFTVSWSEEYDG